MDDLASVCDCQVSRAKQRFEMVNSVPKLASNPTSNQPQLTSGRIPIVKPGLHGQVLALNDAFPVPGLNEKWRKVEPRLLAYTKPLVNGKESRRTSLCACCMRWYSRSAMVRWNSPSDRSSPHTSQPSVSDADEDAGGEWAAASVLRVAC
ncbi:hypothetical protein BCR44DRAFT_1043225 [Catenaria anguillulae PL171]|uniref:Uncharacterized protein n=1 Tax=Catenaria anguillulae PL171 TaxID=765915 RepID=A0A1Y2HU34_9FUNG|nr:hypothetical protein BCR44DRAFT_1043225 [Catenaria anguillulae PL171]